MPLTYIYVEENIYFDTDFEFHPTAGKYQCKLKF